MFRFRVGENRRYPQLVASLLATLISLNAADIVSTRLALGDGLSEGNGALLSMSSVLGTGTIISLLLLKLAFISGAMAVTVIGIRTRISSVRSRVFLFLLALTVIAGIVVANNVYLIGEM